jgi:hypothetical protein
MTQGSDAKLIKDDVVIYVLFKALLKSIRLATEDQTPPPTEDDMTEMTNRLLLLALDESKLPNPVLILKKLEMGRRIDDANGPPEDLAPGRAAGSRGRARIGGRVVRDVALSDFDKEVLRGLRDSRGWGVFGPALPHQIGNLTQHGLVEQHQTSSHHPIHGPCYSFDITLTPAGTEVAAMLGPATNAFDYTPPAKPLVVELEESLRSLFEAGCVVDALSSKKERIAPSFDGDEELAVGIAEMMADLECALRTV